MVAINIKLAPDRDFEMKVARVVGAKLPWSYKKRFFLNLCRSVFGPETSDDEARLRVIKVVEEGVRAVEGFRDNARSLETVEESPDDATGDGTHVVSSERNVTDSVTVSESQSLPRTKPPRMGIMFRFD